MKKVIFLVGPTASGKTEYALQIAEALNGEIISADSMQIYKYMNIGSAKPTIEELSRVKHYLIGEIDPSQPFSVAEYKILANKYIAEVLDQGKLPIVCGGTGLYVNALLYDMDFSAPPGNITERDLLKQKIGQGDPSALHKHLYSLDAKAAEAIHPNNIKRILRAIERLENGEEELSPFKACATPTAAFYPILLGLTRERAELYERINQRVDKLMDMGLIKEVRFLMSKGFTEKDIAMKGIGYKEIIACIDNGEPPESASEIIKLNTRHYAKRQLTWFKRYKDLRWFVGTGEKLDTHMLQDMIDYIESSL